MTRLMLMLPILGSVLLSLAACGSKEPGEDAVATVNGYEITESELNNELIARGVQDLQDPATQKDALEAIINRKLLVALAQERELDQTPDFILAEQRSRELLLADAAARQLGTFNQVPDEAKVNDFVRSNGSERSFFQIEGLRAPALTDPALTRAIEQAGTFSELRDALSAAGVEVKPADVVWDSAGLPPELVQQLNSLPDGKPFVISQENGIFAGVIVQKRRQALTPDQSRQLAEMAVGQQSALQTLNEWLSGARSSAEIIYRKGFGPEESKDVPDPTDSSN